MVQDAVPCTIFNTGEERDQHLKAPYPIRLLVIDIDGTLLDPDHHITTRVRAAIDAAQQRGVVVALASGRRYCVAAPVADSLGGARPMLVYDGALLLTHPFTPSAAILASDYLPAPIAQAALDMLVQHRIQPIIHHFFPTSEEIWTGPSDFDTGWVQAQLDRFPDQVRRYPYDSCCLGQPDPLRVLAYAPASLLTPLLPMLSAFPCSWNITTSHLQDTAVLSIMRENCSKATALTTLAHILAIPLQQVMAIGDDNNDLEMLQCAGWSVAMGQSSPLIKASAQAVTTSNAEDGVAHAIERYVLSTY